MKVSFLKPLLAYLLIPSIGFSQAEKDSLQKWTFEGYGEFYHSFSSNKNLEKQDFIYNHKKNQQISPNLILGIARFNDKNVRANLGIMVGDYAQFNLASEPTWASFVYQASIALKTTKQSWLEVGIFPSHIGFESAIGADCWTLTRSLVAENSPYYEAGLKYTFTSKNNKLTASGLLLNGWQRIEKLETGSYAFGMQLSYTPNDKLLLNYSNYLSKESPENQQYSRTYHNFYVIHQLSKKLAFTFGFDAGNDANRTEYWTSPVFITRFSVSEKDKIALRIENFRDMNGTITNTSDFDLNSFSVNYDRKISDKLLFRIEGRQFLPSDILGNQLEKTSHLTTSLSIKI